MEEAPAARLDVWLSARVEGMSRRQAAKWIDLGHVTVNGLRAVKATALEIGSVVEIWRSPMPVDWAPRADASLSITVRYRDDDLAVVEKPSGIPSVPHSPDELGTLANFSAALFPVCASIGRRPGDAGLVQRLDQMTSGLVLVAFSQSVHKLLVEAQRRGEIEKRYLALVHGRPPVQCKVDLPLLKSGKKGEQMRSGPGGLEAVTEVRRLEECGEWSLVEAVIRHGVRHQIRAHLALSGFPIAGDPMYGRGAVLKGLTRLFLHAHRIGFFHPIRRCPCVVDSPLPDALDHVMTSLRKGTKA